MTWGLIEPSGFGDFFLDGDYVDWSEGLQRHYDEVMTDAERAASVMEDRHDATRSLASLQRIAGHLRFPNNPRSSASRPTSRHRVH